jgi:hypothetical protein
MFPSEDSCLIQDYLKPKTIEIKPNIPEYYNIDQHLLHHGLSGYHGKNPKGKNPDAQDDITNWAIHRD